MTVIYHLNANLLSFINKRENLRTSKLPIASVKTIEKKKKTIKVEVLSFSFLFLIGLLPPKKANY